MTRRALRIWVFLFFVAGLGTIGYWAWSSQNEATASAQQANAFDASVHRLLSSFGELGNTLQSRTALGEGPETWQARAAATLAAIRNELSALRQQTSDASALNDIDAVSAAADQLEEISRQVSALVQLEEFADAGALVDEDALASLAFGKERLDAAWQHERARWMAQEEATDRRLASLAAGTGVVAVAFMLLLVPTGHREASRPSGLIDLRDDDGSAKEPESTEPPKPPAETVSSEPTAVSAPPSATREGGDEGVPVRDRRKHVELTSAAELCTDFARVGEASELPALLDRAARLIDATGLIVWVADPDGQELRPAISHGYPTQVVARLPAISRQADNATAAAWRDAALQVVRTNGMTSGALAVPLLTNRGSVGVLSTEVRHGREASAAVHALTRLVASHIATLVGTPEVVEAAPLSETVPEEAHG